MHTTTKGAVAAGAAAVLLLGGAGSLAYWSETPLSTAGLSRPARSASTACQLRRDTWKYASGSASRTTTSSQGIVPGDSITKICTFTIGAVGDHLSATPDRPGHAGTTRRRRRAGSTLTLAVDATYDPRRATTLDRARRHHRGERHRQALTARSWSRSRSATTTTINVNDTQAFTKTLNDLTVTLTQTSPTGDETPNALILS